MVQEYNSDKLEKANILSGKEKMEQALKMPGTKKISSLAREAIKKHNIDKSDRKKNDTEFKNRLTNNLPTIKEEKQSHAKSELRRRKRNFKPEKGIQI